MSRTQKAAAAGSLTVAAGLVTVAAGTPAMAAAACPSPATEIAPGVCGVEMTADGSFTAPAGVTSLEALLIGGGAAGNNSGYGGGLAGSITYVAAVATSAPISVLIGAGGVADAVAPLEVTASDLRDGGPTSITDANGTQTATGGTMGDGVDAVGTTPSAFVAGVPGTVSLWPAYSGEACFADDGEFVGAVLNGPYPTANAACGGGVQSTAAVKNAAANTGSGGATWFGDADVSGLESAGSGGSGIVLFRYPLAEVTSGTGSAEELADTGAANGGLAAGAAAAIALGAGLLVASRRRSA